ncbi:unnamed protein product [Cladocopium goreaui]|uniref:proton-translocating NAD(P)(+) transhydrogenase n=1 Tax=Cladocopium goreaui TaxID=2562237 RepID=A0A9P1CW40_9DINO|nr:unnamed protein product [Cladocopium goreaui]
MATTWSTNLGQRTQTYDQLLEIFALATWPQGQLEFRPPAAYLQFTGCVRIPFLVAGASKAEAPTGDNGTPEANDAPASPGCKLGVLSEGYSPDAKLSKGDQRVSMVPEVAASLIKDGYAVFVERGAGVFAGYSDEAYEQKGCTVTSRGDTIDKSEVLFALEPPVADFQTMNCKVLISWVGRLQDKGKEIIMKANQYRITVVDVTAVPRITIAQKLDVLSSQAKVAGHRAVLEANGDGAQPGMGMGCGLLLSALSYCRDDGCRLAI